MLRLGPCSRSVGLVLLVAVTYCAPSVYGSVIVGDPANPVSYTISDVKAAGGIQVGDKLFTNFRVVATNTKDAVAPDDTAIKVTPVLIDGDLGLQFNGGWQALGNQLADTTLTFQVVCSYGITGDHLGLGVGGADHGGSIGVSEWLFAKDPNSFHAGNDPFGQLFTYFNGAAGTINKYYDSLSFAPVTSLWVKKDIIADGGTDVNGIGHLSDFTQTFGSPEPATMTMLVLASGAILARRRRRS